MLSNTGSMESVVKYVVYHLLLIAAILFYWIIGDESCPTVDRSNIGLT